MVMGEWLKAKKNYSSLIIFLKPSSKLKGNALNKIIFQQPINKTSFNYQHEMAAPNICNVREKKITHVGK